MSLAGAYDMVLMRCVWHRRYFGYSTIYGVRSWRGAQFLFAEGRCQACAERRRAESRGEFVPVAPLVPPGLPRVALALALVSALVLAARPVNDVGHQASGSSSALPALTRASDPVSSIAPAPSAPVPSPPSDVPPPGSMPRLVAAPPPAASAPLPEPAARRVPVPAWPTAPARPARVRGTIPLPPPATAQAQTREAEPLARSWPVTRGAFVLLSDPAIPRIRGGVPVRLGGGCVDRTARQVPTAPCWTAPAAAAQPTRLSAAVQAP